MKRKKSDKRRTRKRFHYELIIGQQPDKQFKSEHLLCRRLFDLVPLLAVQMARWRLGAGAVEGEGGGRREALTDVPHSTNKSSLLLINVAFQLTTTTTNL